MCVSYVLRLKDHRAVLDCNLRLRVRRKGEREAEGHTEEKERLRHRGGLVGK